MSRQPPAPGAPDSSRAFWRRLRQRGVLRVAFSYAVIAWLVLQVGDVVLEPLGAPAWVMRALVFLVLAGFPIALVLAWFLELGPEGVHVDRLPVAAQRPSVPGVRRYADFIVIALLLVTIAVLVARQAPEDDAPRVLGILPFTELGGAADAYLGDGLADTLSYKLGQLSQITVLAPSSTFQYRGQGLDLATVGQALGATVLLQGTVRRSAASLIVNARLVETGSGRQLWAASIDRAFTDTIEVQEEIAQSMVEALHLALEPEQAARVFQSGTANLGAYDAYLRGRALLATRDPASIVAAVGAFREAAHIDPEFAQAHASLVEALYLQTAYAPRAQGWAAVASEARVAAGRAQALDPDGAGGWLAQAFAARGDNDFGEGERWPDAHLVALLRKALELAPNDAVALKALANLTASPEESLVLLQRAARVDPRSAIIRLNIGDTLRQAGRIPDAEIEYRHALRIDPTFMLGYAAIINLHHARGRLDEAARWGRAMHRANPANGFAYFFYTGMLAQLEAWDELHALRGEAERVAAAHPDDVFWALGLRRATVLEGLAKRDCTDIVSALSEVFAPIPPVGQAWRDVTRQPGGEPGLVALAWCAWVSGDATGARHLLEAGLPDPWAVRRRNSPSHEMRAAALYGAVLKTNGRVDAARAGLESHLANCAGLPVDGDDGIGFSRFFALALLGQADAALDELENVLATNHVNGWWMLDLLDADPDFARVVADPRFRRAMEGVERRVAAARESFRANPELPTGAAPSPATA